MKWASSHSWTKQEDFKTNSFRLLIKWWETCLHRKMRAGFLPLTRVTETFCLYLGTFKGWEVRLSFDLAWQPHWPAVPSYRWLPKPPQPSIKSTHMLLRKPAENYQQPSEKYIVSTFASTNSLPLTLWEPLFSHFYLRNPNTEQTWRVVLGEDAEWGAQPAPWCSLYWAPIPSFKYFMVSCTLLQEEKGNHIDPACSGPWSFSNTTN